MATYRCESGSGTADHRQRDGEVSIPDGATAAEAAAITAAVRAHLRAQRRAAATVTDAAAEDPSWAGRRWRFAGRLAALDVDVDGIPSNAPADPWTAADRSDRL